MKPTHRNSVKAKDEKNTAHCKNTKDGRYEKSNGTVVKKYSLKDVIKLTTPIQRKKFETIHIKADLRVLTIPIHKLNNDGSLSTIPTLGLNKPNDIQTPSKMKCQCQCTIQKEQSSRGLSTININRRNTNGNNEVVPKRQFSAGKPNKFLFTVREAYGTFSVKNKEAIDKSKRFDFTNKKDLIETKNCQLNKTVSVNAKVTGKAIVNKPWRSSFIIGVRPKNPHQPGKVQEKSTVGKPLDWRTKKSVVVSSQIKEPGKNISIVHIHSQKTITKIYKGNTATVPVNPISLLKLKSPKKICLLLTDRDDTSPKVSCSLNSKYILAKYKKYLSRNEVKEIEENTEGIFSIGLLGKYTHNDNDNIVRCQVKSVHNSFSNKATLSSPSSEHKKSVNMTMNDTNTATCLDSYDDEDGYYIISTGDHINYRYEIVCDLGKGSFAQAIKCFDHKTKEYVCIKIIKNKKKFANQALIEIKILEHITRNDPNGLSNIVKYYTNFIFRNHICIVFELLDMNLYEMIREQDFKGLELPVIRKLAIQLLFTLLFMRRHRIIHCDLKPENILLKHICKTAIKVIDFGSACFEEEKMYTYIQSRFYRAPEIILGQCYGKEIDMWSFGCILSELFTGVPIFPGENERDQLYFMMEYLGIPSTEYIQISRKRSQFFDINDEPYEIPNSRGKIRIPNTKSFYTFLQGSDDKFIDFIRKCLQWNPEDRIKPEEALIHPWIISGMPKDILCVHKRSIELVNESQVIYTI